MKTLKKTTVAKHTPGPWKAIAPVSDMFGVDSEVYSMTAHDGLGSSRQICQLARYTTQPDAERQANADLIAAAPELLQALKSLAGFDGTYGNGERMDAVDLNFNRESLLSAARTVIAKAEGRPS